MDTFFHIFLPLPQDRTTGGLIEGWINAAIELLIAIGLVFYSWWARRFCSWRA
jgi:hypothetical protein